MINEVLPNPINQTLFQLSIFRFEISESFFAILWQRNARRPRDSGPCRSEARLQSWDLVWALPLPLQALQKSASALAGPAIVCLCLCRPCKSLPLRNSGLCLCPCRPCKSLPLPLYTLQKSAPAFRPCKILGSASVGPAIV